MSKNDRSVMSIRQARIFGFTMGAAFAALAAFFLDRKSVV